MSRRSLVDLLAVTGLLAAVNITVALWVDGWVSSVLLLASAVLAVAAARARGYSTVDLGMARDDVAAGLKLGGALAALIAAGTAILAVIPFTRGFFEDDRFADLSVGAALFEIAVRIPLITALGEEVLFRGVLLGVLLAAMPAFRAVVVSSIAFGLWHVGTTIGDLDGNGTTADLGLWQSALSVIGVVAVTGVAGVIFALVRRRSASVVAPWLVHTAFNASAFTAGFLIGAG